MAARAYMWLRMDYDVGNDTLMKFYFLAVFRLFRGAVGDKFCFYGRQRNMSSNTRSGLSGNKRGMIWGGKLLVENYPPTNKKTLIRALTEKWDKLPQQLLDNVVQKYGTTWNVVNTLHGGHIPY
ncbi:hypothetical protein TNCV_1618301 [Trichonephila clavipes]|nr:hypothetical protein TNCV_1618301 [Trichonephila clavipes]